MSGRIKFSIDSILNLSHHHHNGLGGGSSPGSFNGFTANGLTFDALNYTPLPPPPGTLMPGATSPVHFKNARGKSNLCEKKIFFFYHFLCDSC